MNSYVWPPYPYKGFSFYTIDDVALLAGRENDIRVCTRRMTSRELKALILFGPSGCGKSSFLRAGLLPILENYNFKVPPGAEKSQFLLIRSTDAPLTRLAEAVYDFVSSRYVLEPLVPDEIGIEIDLQQAVKRWATRDAFVAEAGSDSKLIVEVVSDISSLMPSTLVLVIDQAEEVLTLKPGADGEGARECFFDFLARIGMESAVRHPPRIKLIITMRSEYYGRFMNQAYKWVRDRRIVQEYYLDILNREQLVEAIKRPTSKDAVLEYGVPFDTYSFSYEPGLPEKIADDLWKANLTGSILPFMQIVCDRLYKATKEKHDTLSEATSWTIREADYQRLGGVEGQLQAHLQAIIEKKCRAKGITKPRHIKKEVRYWKVIIGQLAEPQVDGTVTTKIKAKDQLKEVYDAQGPRLDFEEMMLYLGDDEQRVVRLLNIQTPNMETPTAYYSLGHDVIGLALRQEKTAEHNKRTLRRKRMIAMNNWTLTAYTIGAAITGAKILVDAEDIGQIFYGIIVLSFALAVVLFRRRLLYYVTTWWGT